MSFITAPRLLFRADGDARIGLGHLVRLLALAEQLRGLAPGTFLVREPTAAVVQLLAAEGWAVQPLPAGQPWLAEAEWLAASFLQPTDVLVLDGYDFGADYQRTLRRSGCGLVYIDDLRAWPVVADVLINHSPGVAEADYQAAAAGTRFLLGPAFSLLRPPFLAGAALPQMPPAIASALVCFGGADPLRLTLRTLSALQTLPQLRLGVLLGGAFGEAAALEQLAAHAPAGAITIYRNVPAAALAALLRAYDLAVVPASTVLIEALVLGRPALTGYYADNQRALASYVHAHQQAFSAGNFADLTDADLLAALRRGIGWLETHPRQPYAAQLRPDLLRAAVQDLLDRISTLQLN